MRASLFTTISLIGLLGLPGALGPGCKGGAGAAGAPSADEKVRIVLNDYRGLASVFVMENLAGRDLVELRSRPLPPNRPPVAYVEDDVMGALLEQLGRAGFFEHRQARPPDPKQFGAKGEFTMIDADGTMTTILKVPLAAGPNANEKEVAKLKAFVACKATFLQVYNRHRPQLQTTVTTGDQDPFGVRRAEDAGGADGSAGADGPGARR